MALPNPLPDNPLRWDGWKNYNSPNLYERLCLDYASNATPDVIEDNCRQLLVWWQKKLPLKNQPSNPMAQLLRQGLDEAPQFLAEARTSLLDPSQRAKLDEDLRQRVVAAAMDEFKKLLTFALADQKLSEESEEKLFIAGKRLGLSKDDMLPAINAELERTGSQRTVAPPPPPPVPPMPSTPATAPVTEARNAADEFRRLLRMSRLSLDGDEMTDDQRDAMCNMGESLGLTGGEAEDLIDEYLEGVEGQPLQVPKKTMVAVPVRPAPKVAARPKVTEPAPVVAVKKEPVRSVNITPAARVAERQKYANFMNSLGCEMFLVPSSQFNMGSDVSGAQPNEAPVSAVMVSCFYIARFPITNAQYERFDASHRNKRARWADEHHPVIYVSWNEADAFCKWLTQLEKRKYRLPTEAEWELAARGTEQRIFPWGELLNAGNQANFADARTNLVWRDPTINDGFAETSPVGSYPRGASAFGIEDMAGNVHEWCLDWYGPYSGKELVNPRGPASGNQRVYRGGSWRSRASSLRATARSSNAPAFTSNDVGFRIVCECE